MEDGGSAGGALSSLSSIFHPLSSISILLRALRVLRGSISSLSSVHAHRRRSRDFSERLDAADARPGVLFAGALADAFVTLEEAGDEELLRQRREHHPALL